MKIAMIRNKYKVIIVTIIAGAALWLVDAVLDSIIFNKKPFFDSFIFDVSIHEAYMRTSQVILFILFSLLIYRYTIKLKVSESRYYQLFNKIKDAVLVLSADKANNIGRFLEVNDEACKRLGYTREELLKLSIANINSPEDVPQIPARFERLLADKHVLFDSVHVAKDGRRIPVEVNALIVDFMGKPASLAICRDITIRRQAQEALQKAHEELEQRVEERTAELTKVNRQLRQEMAEHRQTAEALKESEQKLRHLATRLLTVQEDERRRVSQELHDEMAQELVAMKLLISSFKEKLQGKNPLKNQESLVQECDQLGQFLQAMVDNIRRLSRDLSPVILKDLGLSVALRNLCDDFCKQNKSIKNCFCNIDEVNDLLPKQDQINIYHIVQESLANISKHSDASQLRLTIERRQDHLSFVLEDNGKGFDPGDVLLRQPTAIGLGLATLEERVRILGGSLKIESKKGAGTRVMFDLPLMKMVNGEKGQGPEDPPPVKPPIDNGPRVESSG
ncbi:MAG: PAS domain-containing sensor histidine kinase [Syntrophales bacterium]|nr:PAS domain-containing sensor histidine kinase [Syntrophales bacterium]